MTTAVRDTATIAQEIEKLVSEIADRTEQHEAFVRDAKAELKALKAERKEAKKAEPKERKPRKPRVTEESAAVKKAVEVLENGATRRELQDALAGLAKPGYVQSLLTGILAKKGYVLEATPDRRETANSREKMYRIVGRR